MNARRTTYGFAWGSADFECACSDDRRGWTITQLETPKQVLQIYTTKTGKVRIFDKDGNEWLPTK